MPPRYNPLAGAWEAWGMVMKKTAPTPPRFNPPGNPHFTTVVNALIKGKVVPFLGAGVNLLGRGENVPYEPGKNLPGGAELAAYLADFLFKTNAEKAREAWNLLAVAQDIAVVAGTAPLYEQLRTLFNADYPSNPLHQLLAELPSKMRAKGYAHRPLVIVTTNYDTILEDAFKAAKEPYDLVTYVADGEAAGKFLHWPPGGGDFHLVKEPNEYRELLGESRTAILKIHGAVDRISPDGEQDSYVITEDHYIDYLTRSTDFTTLLPVSLGAKLSRNPFLFLGYSLSDWNLRVLLHRVQTKQKLNNRSWAILKQFNPLDQESWDKRGVDLLDMRLEEYVAELDRRINSLPDVETRRG